MKKIFLHIGQGKTGTTFLQNTLASNSAELNNSNFCYPNGSAEGKIQSGNIPGMARFDFAYLTSILENEVTNNQFDNIIFSCEFLLGLFNKNIPDLINLFNLFKTKGIEIHLVICIRDVNSHCKSLFSQKMKDGSYNFDNSIEDFLLKSYATPQATLKILKTCQAFAIPCHAFKYDKNDLLRDFSTAIGLDFDLNAHSQGIINRSLSTNELMILSAFQHFPRQELKKLTWALVELVPNLHSHKYKCDESTATRFAQQIDPVIDQINQIVTTNNQIPNINISELTAGDELQTLTDSQIKVIHGWINSNYKLKLSWKLRLKRLVKSIVYFQNK